MTLFTAVGAAQTSHVNQENENKEQYKLKLLSTEQLQVVFLGFFPLNRNCGIKISDLEPGPHPLQAVPREEILNLHLSLKSQFSD